MVCQNCGFSANSKTVNVSSSQKCTFWHNICMSIILLLNLFEQISAYLGFCFRVCLFGTLLGYFAPGSKTDRGCWIVFTQQYLCDKGPPANCKNHRKQSVTTHYCGTSCIIIYSTFLFRSYESCSRKVFGRYWVILMQNNPCCSGLIRERWTYA